jgi:hypothetical protein
LVTALLDVFDSNSSFRSFLRRLGFLLAGILTRGAQGDDQRANRYQWEIGEETGGLLPVRITYLIGSPQSVPIDSAD